MFPGLICCNEIYRGNDAIGSIELKFGADILNVSRIIYQAKMLPVPELAGMRMTDRKVWKKSDVSQMKCAFIAERNPIGV